MNKRRWVALIIFFILFFTLVVNSGAWKNIFDSGEGWEIETYQEGKGENLAMIDITGVITSSTYSNDLMDVYSHNILLDQLETAFEDDSIGGIILRVNSPGGTVNECDEVFQKINKLKGTQDKPLVVYMDSIAASGAYLISSTADIIYANRNTITGSIGVIISTLNVHQLAEDWGVRDEVFKSGPYKDILNPLRDVNSEERAIIQELVDESYNFFIDAILEGRDMDREALLEIADGRIYSGPQAKENGLIDEVGFLDEAIEQTAELAGITDPNVIHYVRVTPSTLDYLLSRLQFPSGNMYDLSNLVNKQLHNYPSLMYIWSW